MVPDGIMNRSNDKKLRDFILEQCIIDAVISLPMNTFFTTNKKTYILILEKKAPVKVNGVDSVLSGGLSLLYRKGEGTGQISERYGSDYVAGK